MHLAQTTEYLESLQAAAALFLVWRLFRFGLLSETKAMAGLQLWTIVTSVGFVFLYSNQHGYENFYSIFVPIGCVIHILAVRELFAIVFESYPGIRTLGRWTMYCATAISLTISMLIARIFWVQLTRVTYVMVLERSVLFSLAFFILSILFFLSRYPLQLPRNFSLSSSFFCAVFLTEALVLLLVTVHPSFRAMDAAGAAISVFCLFLWGFLLRAGEEPSNRGSGLGNGSNSPDEDALLRELASINTVLGRAVRR